MKTVADARELELSRITAWLLSQVAPTMSAAVDAIGDQLIEAMLIHGRRKRGRKFDALIELSKRKPQDLI
jgi:hypothetical protein